MWFFSKFNFYNVLHQLSHSVNAKKFDEKISQSDNEFKRTDAVCTSLTVAFILEFFCLFLLVIQTDHMRFPPF